MKVKSLPAVLLALLLTFALAEGTLTLTVGGAEMIVPAGMEIQEHEGVTALVRNTTRAVVQLIPQEMTDAPQEQLRRLMSAYHQDVTQIEIIRTGEGLTAARGVIENCFGEGLHQYPLMVLDERGLLILSVYDLGGDNASAQAVLEEFAALNIPQ